MAIDWQQILLHLLNFVILFAGLWLLLYKPVRSFMQKRREHYEKMDADAVKKQADAEAAQAAYTQKLAAAEEEIAEKRRAAERETAAYGEEKRRETDELARGVIAAAKEDAERIKAQAEKDARARTAQIVTEAVEKLVLEESASEAFEAFLSAADGADEADCEGAQTAKQNQKPAGKTAGPRKKAEKKDE